MDGRTVVRLMAGVLAAVAVGLLLAGVVIVSHGATAGDDAVFVGATISFCAAGSLAVASFGLAAYLRQTGSNPAR